MTDKKYVVPQGMLDAATEEWDRGSGGLRGLLEAAIRWQSENPIVPTKDQTAYLSDFIYKNFDPRHHSTREVVMEWQRRMYLAPEPVVPEAIKDLLFTFSGNGLVNQEAADKRIEEAYNRGVASARKEAEAK